MWWRSRPRRVPREGLALLTLAVLTFGVVLPRACRDWAYSAYYDSRGLADADLVRRAAALNARRLADARRYFASLRPPATTAPPPGKDVDLAIAIIGMTRRTDDSSPPGYLTQTAAALHRQLARDRYFPNKYAFICNVDADPDKVAEVAYLKPYIASVDRFGSNGSEQLNLNTDKFNKSKDDYAFCMEAAYTRIHRRNPPKYVLILEDDAVVKENFFRTLHRVLNTTLPLLEEHEPGSTRGWAFLKLYYPDKWAGYGRDWGHHAERAGVALCGGSVFAAVASFCRARGRYSWASSAGWFAAGALYCLAVAQTVGRPYVLPALSMVPRVSRPAPDCCTQAVLFPGGRGGDGDTAVVPALTAHLRASPASPDLAHDLLMDRWADAAGRPRLLVTPNAVTHVGMVSTVRQWAKKAAHFIY